jgi:hypothetical protein
MDYLNDKFEFLLFDLSRDPEVVENAINWMDYECDVMKFFNMKYWTKIKNKLYKLNKKEHK